jgi:hypothetical protein
MTLNQQYKQSGTDKSFKEWLELQQQEGAIDFETEDFMNQNGGENKPIELTFLGVPVVYLGIGLLVIIGGAIVYRRLNK